MLGDAVELASASLAQQKKPVAQRDWLALVAAGGEKSSGGWVGGVPALSATRLMAVYDVYARCTLQVRAWMRAAVSQARLVKLIAVSLSVENIMAWYGDRKLYLFINARFTLMF